jgi:hypothetical protein
MATTLHVSAIRGLLEASAPPCVSIYLPTHRGGPATHQNPIRLKNAIAAAEERLAQRGGRRSEVEAYLRPVRALIDVPELFWRQADGFAAFLSPKTFQTLRLTVSVPELVVVGERFHLKPLMPLLVGDGRFYILAVSQDHVRLLEASREGAREVEVPGMPRSLEEGINADAKQHYFQEQLRDPHSATERSDVTDAMLEPFLLRVDGALTDLLEEERAPLVLAGVKRIRTAYRHLSKYGSTLERGIDGDPDERSETELQREAWELVSPIFQGGRQQSAERYRELKGTGRASADLRQVLRAACQGRVESIFVPADEQRWGRFHPEPCEIEPCAESLGEDLLDRAALEVLVRRGVVYAVPRAEMPGPGAVNAVYRY